MKNITLILSLFICLGAIKAQDVDTFYLHIPISKNDTIIYKRIIKFDMNDSLYHVQDYYPNGQIQMEGTYSSFDKSIKEKSLWCNYHTNTKEGEFKGWYKNGKIDKVVEFEDTEWIVNQLKGKNKDLKFTVEPDVGHWIDWLVYPNQELYDWFLKYDKRIQNKN